MNFLSNIRIKNKIIIIIVIVGIFSAIIGNLINYFYEVEKSKERLISNTLLQARLISEYCGLPMEFNYADKALEVLEKVKTIPDIFNVLLFTSNDSLFAAYHKSENIILIAPSELKNNNYFIEGNYLHVSQPVIFKEQNYGYLYLRSFINWEDIITRRIRATVTIILIMMIIIFVLASILQRSISRPILSLTKNMNTVAKNKDYGVQFSNPSKDEIGELYIGFNNMLREIKKGETDLKSILESLKFSEERFRILIQRIPFPIAFINNEGIIILRNDRFIQTLGYLEDEVPTIAEWWPKAYPEEHYRRSVINTWENAVKNATEENSDIESSEYYVRSKSGGILTMEISGFVMKEGILATFIDLTERKKAEEDLKQSEYRFRELFDEAPIGYHEIDKHGMIIKINNTELKMLQYEKDEMLNHFVWEFIVDEENSKSSISDKLDGISFSNKSYERTFRRKDGSTFFGLLEDILLKSKAGDILGIRTTVQDITLQKRDELALYESNIRLERTLTELKETQKMVLQQERMRALGQLASGIAHDINNSLSPILGYSDMLLDDEHIFKQAGKYLIMIKKSSIDIRTTINRMKEFYRPKIEQEEFENIDINEIIESTIELTKHKWKDMAEQEGKVIKVNTELTEKLPAIKGSESEIREALTNIIINAADAMPEGGILTLKNYSSDINIIIEILDTGIGMDKETLNRCMDPFYTTKNDKGTGLGLSMVYGIMLRHNGKIEIESERNKGSLIRLIFPIDNVNSLKTENDEQVFIPPLKILCIDDDKSLREMVFSILTNKNHVVKLAEDGKSGMAMFFDDFNKGEPFNLVITDLGMPYMDGKSVADGIKSKSPVTPIILLTGWGAFIEKDSIKNVDYILKKPVTLEELNKAIRIVLKL